jgi:type II secretory pathway pseudopilin PulG
MALTDAPPPPERPKRSQLAAVLPYTSVAVIIAALYVVWTFYSRHEANMKAQQQLAAQQAEQRQREARTIFGSGGLSFRTWSADKAVVRPGETAHICYGIVDAKTVNIDPPVEQLKPSYLHCFDVNPRKTTTYTITAADAAGHTASEHLTIQVR